MYPNKFGSMQTNPANVDVGKWKQPNGCSTKYVGQTYELTFWNTGRGDAPSYDFKPICKRPLGGSGCTACSNTICPANSYRTGACTTFSNGFECEYGRTALTLVRLPACLSVHAVYLRPWCMVGACLSLCTSVC